jgi:cell wall-associated NlpC family hydrolase
MRLRHGLPLVMALVALAGCNDSAAPKQSARAHAKPAAEAPPADEIDLGAVDVPSRRKKKPASARKREEELAKLERESKQGDTGPTSGAPSDDEVRRELAELERKGGMTKSGIRLGTDGLAFAPPDAPPEVEKVIRAGNVVARAPYRWGGGHGRWLDSGYDCSGSVSFALFAAGLLDGPLDSSGLARWGKPGPGKWITVFANDGHVFMAVGGLRFDTSGRDSSTGGSRWQLNPRGTSGFSVRHWPGL